MTGCNQSKVSSPKSVSVNVVNPGTAISGNHTVCSFGTTFTVNDISPLNTVRWTVGPFLSIVSGQNTSSCEIKSTGSGSSWINAEIISACGNNNSIPIYSVWSGRPTIDPQIPLAYFDGSTYNDVCNSQWYSTTMNIQPAEANVYWSRIAANPGSTEWYQSGNNVSFYFFAVGQTAVYEISASNDCGCNTNDFGFKSKDCSSGGGGGCDVTYVLSPNPASDLVTITPQIPAPCDPVVAPAITESAFLSVYDQQGTLKQKIKYKSRTEAKIDVSKLKDGIYFVRVVDGNSTKQQTLVVHH